MTDVLWVEDEQQLKDLIDIGSDVVVDFTAPAWCQPCKQFAPHFDKAAEASDATFVAVDVDKAPWAMQGYGVRGVPTVKHYRDGEYVADLKARTVVALLNEIK